MLNKEHKVYVSCNGVHMQIGWNNFLYTYLLLGKHTGIFFIFILGINEISGTFCVLILSIMVIL